MYCIWENERISKKVLKNKVSANIEYVYYV